MPLIRDRTKQAHGEQVACVHCGTRFEPVAAEDKFCCAGCEYVFRVISDESLERFYELRGGVSQPVGSSVFANTDFSWIEPLALAAESDRPVASLILAMEGVSCVGCVWLIDHLFSQRVGGLSCRVNVQYGTLDLEWRSGEFDVADFARELKRFGYRVCPAREARDAESRQVAWKLGLAGAFALNGMLYTLPGYLGMESGFVVALHFNWLSALFATLSMIFGGSYFIGKAVKAAAQRIAHLDLPISIGIVFAYLVSWYGMLSGAHSLIYFDFVSTFIFLMLVGRWLQIMAIERNRNRLADMLLRPPEVEIESAGGGRVKASASQLVEGDHFWLSAGQRIPVRSVLLSSRASLGMDWISGETESRLVEAGGEVPSGAALENQFPVSLRASEDWDQSLLCRLSRRSPRSQERDSVAQKWIFRYLLVACSVAVAGGLGWAALSTVTDGLKVFISVLVVSCPCALGIAWPFADETALAHLKRNGVFVTTHSLWNRLSQVRRVVFDKTGTLTRSTLTLLNPEVMDSLSESELQALCAACAKSRHPVSSTIRESLMAKGRFRLPPEFEVVERVGHGVELSFGGAFWKLGRGEWACAEGARRAGTLFARDGTLVAELLFDDQPLPDSLREVEALRQRGLHLSILSGDKQEKAEKVGRLLGVEPSQVFGNMLPEGKADWLSRHEGEECMMVGDGANDTLAFEKALCCGAPANDQGVVAERADFHYLGNGIQGIRRVVEMGRLRRRTIAALLVFAISYNLVAVGFSLLGLVTPLFAAILMPFSSIVSLAIVWGMLGKGRR